MSRNDERDGMFDAWIFHMRVVFFSWLPVAAVLGCLVLRDTPFRGRTFMVLAWPVFASFIYEAQHYLSIIVMSFAGREFSRRGSNIFQHCIIVIAYLLSMPMTIRMAMK